MPDPSACEWDETRREMIKNFDHTSSSLRGLSKNFSQRFSECGTLNRRLTVPVFEVIKHGLQMCWKLKDCPSSCDGHG